MSSSGNKKSSDLDTAKQTASRGAGQYGNMKGSNDKKDGGSNGKNHGGSNDKSHEGSSDPGTANKGAQSGTKSGNGSGKFTILICI